METYLDGPDVFDYVTFVNILIGILSDILIVDTIVHKTSLRKGMRLVLLSWSICDLFYLFNTSGFLHFLLKSFGLHVAPETNLYIFQPHLLEEPASGVLLQSNCLIVMWVLAFTSPTSEDTTMKNCIRWFMFVTFLIINLLIIFLKYDFTICQIDYIRRAFISLLAVLIFVNEFHYLHLMCDDDLNMDIVTLQLLKINMIRVYVYNWCFVYFMKYIAAYGFHDAATSHTAAKYLYVLSICLTLTAFLTGFYILIHLLCNDMAFRNSFICTCVSLRRGQSINIDPNEMSAILSGTRYQQLYYTSEVM